MRYTFKPARPGSRGGVVADLHGGLATLGYNIAADERAAASYGRSTSAAIAGLQRAHQLEPTGSVDERTAELLTRLVREALSETPRPADPAARRPLPKGAAAAAPGSVLRLLGVDRDRDNAPADKVVRDIAGRDLPAGVTPEAFLVSVLRARGHGHLADDYAAGEDGRYIVAGAIDRQEKVEGLTVTIVRERLGQKLEVLAKTAIDANGEFAVRFDTDPDAVVRAVIEDDRDRLYVSPPQRIQQENWIEWSGRGGKVPRPGAFELREALLASALAPAGRELHELEESRERLDIAVLAEMTGLSRAHVGLHGVAARLEKELGIDRAAVFALLGRPLSLVERTIPPEGSIGPFADFAFDRADIEALQREIAADRLAPRAVAAAKALVLGFDDDALRTAVRQSIRSGQLSVRTERTLDAQADALLRARRAAVLDSPAGRRASWRELLGASGVPDPRVDAAADVLLAHGDGPALWMALGEAAGEDLSQRVERTVRLARALDLDARAIDTIERAGVTSGRDLARRPAADLEALLGQAFAHLPDPAASAAEAVAMLDRTFPGDSLVRRRRGDLSAATVGFLDSEAGRATEPLTLNVEGLYRARQLAGDDRDAARTVRSEVMRLQRTGRVARDGAAASALLDAGYDSAARIAFTDRAEFLRTAAAAGTPEALTMIHRRARAHYRATVAAFLRLNQAVNGPSMQILASTSQAIAAADIANAPSWEFLFGSPDFCDCENCASVTSPAAYLVDLLLWLGRAPGGAPRPYDVLTNRRPDLVKIVLNCRNTETLVPYIDLVCELLEEEVAIRVDAQLNPGAPGLTAAVLGQRRRARQTNLSAEQIRAYPEHIDTAVYTDTISQFARSFVSPFDLPGAEVRAHLALKSLTRLELMQLFGTGTAVERSAERLDIPPVERAVITAAVATQAEQQTQWGFIGPIVPLPDFLRRSGLSYDRLESMLACTFANPQRNDPMQAVIVELNPGVTADVCRASDRRVIRQSFDTLDRQHRLLRLARHLTWSLPEIDLLIWAVGGGQLDGPCLANLGDCAAIAQQLGLSPAEIAFLFRDFDNRQGIVGATFDGGPTLYARIFLSRTDGGGPPVVFRNPAANPTPLNAERARLSGALGLTEADFDRILGAAGIAGDISFPTLSTLYRHARLAQASGLTIEDFESLRAVVVDPFASPANLLGFLTAGRLVKDAKLTAAALGTLSGQVAVTVPDAAPLVTALDELFQATAAQMALDTGAAPAAADVVARIQARRSWAAVVTSWLQIDSRFAETLAALDAAVGAGQIATDLYTNPQVAATLALLARLGVLVDALKIGPDLAARLAVLPGVLDVVRQPTWPRLANAIRFVSLMKQAESPDDLQSYLTAVPDNAVARAALAQRIGAALDVDAAIVEAFWDALYGAGNVDRAQLVDHRHYDALRRIAAIAATLGVDLPTLRGWAGGWPTAAHAVQVRNAIRAGMTETDWLKASTKVQDELRERRRDALVQYLLATAGPGDPTNAAEMYGRFLIDVEMDDCMDTSRIVQANAAIQLFVQRCFLGLENVARDQLATDHWKEWEWRQRYRLWQANRTVFLYPENFLNVARRSNASPLFAHYMKEVRQSDGTEENVRGAVDTYLGGLEDIANFDHAAIAANLEGDAEYRPELHLVARTRGTPQKHYHCRLSGGVWSPWQELSIGTPGRHLTLIQHEGRSTLLWPTWADHSDTRMKMPAADTAPEQEPAPTSGITYLSYAWVTRDRKQWTTVQTSARALLHRKRARRPFVTTASPQGNALDLLIYAPLPPKTNADTYAPTITPLLGSLAVERDIVAMTVFDDRRSLNSWLGGDHQAHLDSTGVFQPFGCSLGPDCGCLIFSDLSIEPWPDLVFDDNRMIAPLGTSRLKVELETPNPSVRRTATLFNARGFSIAADVTRRRAKTQQLTFVAQGKHLTIFNWTLGLDFGPDVFVFTDDRRSFLCTTSNAQSQLAPAADAPAVPFLAAPAYHPFATDLRNVVRRYEDGLERLYTPRTQETPASLGRAPLVFTAQYGNHPSEVVFSTAAEELEFDAERLYALYNWELFFHVPLFAAEQQRLAGAHAIAQRFYHFIFTPFTPEPIDPARPRARYWITKPFREANGDPDDIRDIIINGAITHTNPYRDIEAHPFDAQLVAQTRPSAYQKHVVMRYLDNLLGWGDSLYRRGQREDMYEAIQQYELARTILGYRPEKLRPLGQRVDLAFEDTDWSGGANALVDLENIILDAGAEPDEFGNVPLIELPLVPGLYFCVPPNQQLLQYWDTLERRLYNIHHCLTIDGRPVRYDLLAAPINPQALVDAAAAGVSVGQALAMAGSMLPPYRFRVLWAKAQDACSDVKALGGALQAALERRDAEQLARVRSLWEGRVLEKGRTTRETQRSQASSDVDALSQARVTMVARRDYYQTREPMSDLEKAALGLSIAAAGLDTTGLVFDVLGGVLYLIPNVDLGVSGFGGTPQAGATTGGESAGNSTARTSQGLSRIAGLLDRAGGMVSTQAGYARRREEWDHQASQASLDITHLDMQIAAAKLRVAISDAELLGHLTTEASWAAMDALLTEKFTNQERYEWLIESVRALYQQAFQQAVRLAKLARECLAFEVPPGTAVPVIGETHWDTLQHGLLAGDRLAADLRELDVISTTVATHERLIVQHVALSHVAPEALLALRRTGRCAFRIPRWWFQRFDPGLRNRRIQMLSISTPSVTGPYVGMNATLAFQGASRTRSVISLSTGVNDLGEDQTPASDRYLPFEGISLDADTNWTFGFPQDPADANRVVTDVNFSTIADVILHFQYTADTAAALALDGPPVLMAFVDLAQMDAVSWNELTTGAAHQTAVAVTNLVPRFLTGYRVDALIDSVAIMKDQSVATAKLAFAIAAVGANAGKVTIALKVGEAIDWPNLYKVYIIARMIR